MNPLNQPNTIFDLALMNPNPTSTKTKEGPRYRIAFEVERDVWDLFMEADTAGMIIAAKAAVVGDAAPECEPITAKPKAKGKGEHGAAWAQLYRSGWWRCPDVWPLLGTDAEYQAWCRTKLCAAGAMATSCAGDIVAAHVRRINLGAGTGIKPQYATIPLCDKHHREQHQHGESVIGGSEYVDRALEQHRTEWLKQAIREWFCVESCSQIEPKEFGWWIKSKTDGLAYVSLPKEFKQ